MPAPPLEMKSRNQVLIPFDSREAITLNQAAQIATVSARSVQRWCSQLSIGRKIGSEWRVSRVALQMYLNDDGRALQAYLRGDRSSPMVAIYFAQFALPPVLKLDNLDNLDKRDTKLAKEAAENVESANDTCYLRTRAYPVLIESGIPKDLLMKESGLH